MVAFALMPPPLDLVGVTDAASDAAASTYNSARTAWNDHTDALLRDGSVQWEALAALVGGCVAAFVLLWLFEAVGKPLIDCLSRTRLDFHCPVSILVAPERDRLPTLWPKGTSRCVRLFLFRQPHQDILRARALTLHHAPAPSSRQWSMH